MSFKISAPNYTQSPNVLFDEIFKALKEGELRIVLVLIRQTFGWHKEWDRISIGKIAEKSGLDKRSVTRSLKSLIEKGIVEQKRFGKNGKETLYFRLVMEEIEAENFDDDDITEEEMEFLANIKKIPTPDTKDRGPLTEMSQTPDTKTPTKETIQNKKKEIDCSESLPPDAAKTFNVKKITLKQFDKTDLLFSYDDLLTLIVKNRKDWTKQEIDHLWKVLENFNNPVRDLIKFCSTTIENLRKSNISKKIISKENKCQNIINTPPSKKQFVSFNGNISEKDISMPLFQNWKEVLGFKN